MDVLASPLRYIYIYVDFRTPYSWTCDWEYKDEEVGLECSCGFAVSPLYYSRVLQVAVVAASVVWSTSGMGYQCVCFCEDLGSLEAENGASSLFGTRSDLL